MMQIPSVFVLVLILLKQFQCTNQHYDLPSSPCPNLFQYKYDGNNWIGELELPSPPIQHHEVVLHITLSLRAATTVSSCSINKTEDEMPLTFNKKNKNKIPTRMRNKTDK